MLAPEMSMTYLWDFVIVKKLVPMNENNTIKQSCLSFTKALDAERFGKSQK